MFLGNSYNIPNLSLNAFSYNKGSEICRVIQEKMFIACGYLHYEITSLLE